MNEKLSVICAFAMVCVIACKKQDQPVTNNTTATNKVKKYTSENITSTSHTFDTFNISYDSQERILSIIGKNSRSNYQYSNGYYAIDTYDGTVLRSHQGFYINSNSLVDSSIEVSNIVGHQTAKYYYNAAGKPELIKYYSGSDNHYFFYNSNDDLSDEIVKDIAGATKYSFQYGHSGIEGINPFPELYFREKSKHLVTSMTLLNPSGTSSTTNFSYTLDSINRITSQTAFHPSSPPHSIIKYFY